MALEQVAKFQPDRTIYMRGTAYRGAMAAIHSASPTGFTVSGIFRDAADFCVLVVYDIDDFFGHPSIKPLPDPNLAGMVLEYDVAYSGLQPLDSPKSPTIIWPYLEVVRMDGSLALIDLTLGALQGSYPGFTVTPATSVSVASGTEVKASVTIALNVSGSLNGDFLTLWFENYAYSYALLGGDNPTFVAAQLAAAINAESYAGNIYGLTATSSGASITITASHPGPDGNMIRLYWVATNSGREFFTTANPIKLSGGASATAWHVKLDFTALGIDDIRQAWLTFAPQLADSAVYADTPWDAVFSNWGITSDPNGVKLLKVAGANSVRVEEDDAWVTAVGSWAQNSVGWYSQGFAVVSPTLGDTITVTYWCQHAHDLWLGTAVGQDRGKFSVAVDGVAQANLDTYLATGAVPISTRRKLASGIAAGRHTVVLTIIAANGSSSGTNCYFDFLEAVVASDFPAALAPCTDRAPAIDYDTDHGFKLAPARLLWMFEKLGFINSVPIDEYIGVFWECQRKVSGQTVPGASITFGSYSAGAALFVDVAGTTIGKTVFASETPAIFAAHFAYYINETFVGVFASASGAVLTITNRSAQSSAYDFTLSAYSVVSGVTTPLTVSGSLAYSTAVGGTWLVDTTQAPALNYPTAKWHSDLFASAVALGASVVSAFSMELVDTPDDPGGGHVWVARSYGGGAVLTDTGFGGLNSAQCVPMAPEFLAYQKACFLHVAQLQTAASHPVQLQCGEFLWWFFSYLWFTPIGSVAILSYVRLGFASPHGCAVGDTVRVADMLGITSINGTWTVVAVPDATHIDITAPYGGGTWTTGSGTATGGSMAYYDDATTAAAITALGQPLHEFTFPTDNPNVNSYADANFLAGRLALHVAAIITYVQATYPAASFEILFPYDVNGPTVTPITKVGGVLNAYVNFPVAWQSQAAAPFDVFKLEQLAFGTTDRSLDLVKNGLAIVKALAWPASALRYLYPVDNPGVPQWREYRLAKRAGFNVLTPFAMDHICLMGWRVSPPEDGFSEVL